MIVLLDSEALEVFSIISWLGIKFPSIGMFLKTGTKVYLLQFFYPLFANDFLPQSQNCIIFFLCSITNLILRLVGEYSRNIHNKNLCWHQSKLYLKMLHVYLAQPAKLMVPRNPRLKMNPRKKSFKGFGSCFVKLFADVMRASSGRPISKHWNMTNSSPGTVTLNTISYLLQTSNTKLRLA